MPYPLIIATGLIFATEPILCLFYVWQCNQYFRRDNVLLELRPLFLSNDHQKATLVFLRYGVH